MELLRQGMKMSIIFIATSIYTFSLLAQATAKTALTTQSIPESSSPSPIEPLSVGDEVPDIEFTMFNYPTSKARLSDFRGKFIILDFWATWCTSCLHKFPKLDSLQKIYSDELQVILVNSASNGDDANAVSLFFEKRRNSNGAKYKLPSIVYDSIFTRLFPYKMIPHYVWISNDGVVRAITSSDEISKENLEIFLKGDQLNVPLKIDLELDPSKPLFVNRNGGSAEKYIYRSFLMGYAPGLPSASGINSDSSKKESRIFGINLSILSLYQLAYPQMRKYRKNRIILDVENKLKYTADGEWDVWKYNNAYVYELILPLSNIDTIRKFMREDLKRFFGLNVRIENRKALTLVLRQFKMNEGSNSESSSNETNIYRYDKSQKFFRNYSISSLVNYLNIHGKTPVIDQTKFTSKINMNLPGDLMNIELLNRVLNRYGFNLVEELREIEFFVLSDDK